MSGIVSWFARNAVAANLLMIVAFIGGMMAFNRMEREMFPVVPVAGASVTVIWNGASPPDVEEQIITRVEEVVADIDGLDRITSIAYEGGGTVNIRGRDDIDMQEFLDEIKIRVDQINNLPQAAFQPQVTRWEARNWYFGMVVHGDVDPLTLKRLADDVRDDIAELPGGELAEVQGVLDEEVSIEVSENDLRRYNLSFSDVANAIRNSSLNSSGGRVRSSVGDISVATRQLADTQEQFEGIIVRETSAEGTIRGWRCCDGYRWIYRCRSQGRRSTISRPPLSSLSLLTRWILDATRKVSGIILIGLMILPMASFPKASKSTNCGMTASSSTRV